MQELLNISKESLAHVVSWFYSWLIHHDIIIRLRQQDYLHDEFDADRINGQGPVVNGLL